MIHASVFKSLKDPKLAETLQSGSVGIMPTDTIYGIVAKASDKEAVGYLYKLKNRHHKPGTVIAANLDQLVELGVTRRYMTAVADFWPNPISVVVPVSENLKYLSQDEPTLAVRIPNDEALAKLLLITGPLMTTSANLPDQKPAADIQQAQAIFADDLDFYVDGGSRDESKPSTVVRIIDDSIEVLREGAIKFDENGRIKK